MPMRLYYYIIPFFCGVILFLTRCTADKVYSDPLKIDYKLKDAIRQVSPDGTVGFYKLPYEGDFAQIPQDPANPLNAAKVSLGMYLFYETGIGLDPVYETGKQTYSCATCHVPESGFKPGRLQGIADGAEGFGNFGSFRVINDDYHASELDVQGTRAISLFNVAYVKNTFWNGQFGSEAANEGTEDVWSEEDNTHVNALGFKALESQNIEGLGLHRMLMNAEIADSLGYTSLFDIAFREVPKSERYSIQTAAFAISAYLRTLLTNQTPFQQWLKGDYKALTESQKEGAILFFGKAGCVNCHYEKNLGSGTFHAIGVKDLNQTGGIPTAGDEKKNLGRGGFTKNPEDNYKFKVPQLYNLKNAPFYFHGSSKRDLDEVIEYFNLAEKENNRVPQEQISEFFKPLYLTEDEKRKLQVFLEEGLNDPNIHRYVPPYVLSGKCFPNNDVLSRAQTGCGE